MQHKWPAAAAALAARAVRASSSSVLFILRPEQEVEVIFRVRVHFRARKVEWLEEQVGCKQEALL